ncbi:hypothetical protein E2C01_095513 [Portunus trituberculatus]|uniref:Uncharacterized protein n=1 Tax=Portunus trituberculatus TaxID=210409 RepID=A0A5B7JZK9_PORTR|nr:hypothetical protein [Portunus trituberculatus]
MELSYPLKRTGPGEKLTGRGGICWRSSGSAMGLGIEEGQPEMMKRTLSQNLHCLVELPGKPLQPEGTVREHPPPTA